jgi:hypothetical protein
MVRSEIIEAKSKCLDKDLLNPNESIGCNIFKKKFKFYRRPSYRALIDDKFECSICVNSKGMCKRCQSDTINFNKKLEKSKEEAYDKIGKTDKIDNKTNKNLIKIKNT